jgi:hypothetical protein
MNEFSNSNIQNVVFHIVIILRTIENVYLIMNMQDDG